MSWSIRAWCALTHWINAAAILIMIGSGWRIYNNVPIFPAIEFPLWATLGGDPDLTYARNSDVGFSNALLWHLAGMWLFAVNGLVYLVYGILSGRLFRKLFPIRPREVMETIADTLRFKLAHEDLAVYNGVQKLLYLGVIAAMILAAISGLSLWKPVQFQGPDHPLPGVSGSKARALPVHVGDRALSRRACDARAPRAAHAAGDAHRTGPRAVAPLTRTRGVKR